MKNENKDKIKKAVNGTHIAVTILLFLAGVALTAFFVWLGYKIVLYLGGAA